MNYNILPYITIFLSIFSIPPVLSQVFYTDACSINQGVYCIAKIDVQQQTQIPILNVPNSFGVSDITMDKSGVFYVTDNNHLLRVKPLQNPLPPPNWNYVSYDTLAVISHAKPIGGLVSLAIDCNEKIFIGDVMTKNIWTYDLHTGVLMLLGTYQPNFYDFEFYEGRLYAHCYENTSGWGRSFLMDIHLDDLTVMDTTMEIENSNPTLYGETLGITSINQPCGPNLLYATQAFQLLQFFVEDSTYLRTPFPLLCAGGATSPTSWMGSYTPLGIETVEVRSINGDCSPPYSLTAHKRKGYYIRPDIQYSLDGVQYQSDSVFTVTATGKYVIHVQDSFGCHKVSDSITVGLPEFSSRVEVLSARCGKASGSAFITTDSGTEITTDGVHYSPDSLRIDYLDAGTYIYYLRNTSGCMDTLSFTIAAEPPPAIQSVSVTDAGCNQSDGVIVIIASGSNIHYQLDTVQNTSGVFNDLAPGSYTVQIIDTNQCTSDTMIVLQGKTPPVITDVLTEDAHCNRANATIKIISSDSDLTISLDGQQYLPVTSLSGLSAGSYTLYVRNTTGCIISVSAVLNQTGLPAITDVMVTDVKCEGEKGSIHFNATGQEPLTYEVNGLMIPSTYLDSVNTGNYELTVQDRYGCVAMWPVTVGYVSALGNSLIVVDRASCETGKGTLTFGGDGGSLYYEVGDKEYRPGESTELEPGLYKIIIRRGECEKDSTVEVKKEECAFFIPNAFSPNHDQINDAFKVEGDVIVEAMLIYDRWGACLYAGDGAGASWDGTFRGVAVQPGTYVYWIRVRLSDGRTEVRKGDVTVVR